MLHRFQDIAAEIVSIVNWQSLGIPKGHAALSTVRALEKRLWFESSPDMSNLFSVSEYLCIYGFLDRARRMAMALSAIPNGTERIDYAYIHECFTLPCCFIERTGDIDDASALRELALHPPGKPYVPGPGAYDGYMLANFFKNPDYERTYGYGMPLSDIPKLALMWVFGSTSPHYATQRIGELIDINLAEVYSYQQWRPWRSD